MERKKDSDTFVAEPGIEEAKALFEACRKLKHIILELLLDYSTSDQSGALGKLTGVANMGPGAACPMLLCRKAIAEIQVSVGAAVRV